MSLNVHHTPGPLKIAGRETRGLPHTLVAARTLLFRVYSEAYGDFDQETENASRLVACWNACEGVQTNEIEELAAIGGVPSLITYSKDLRAERDLAWQHRDRLREMLEELLDIEGPQPGTRDWADRARAVIEQVTGSAA